MAVLAGNGLVTMPVRYSVDRAVELIEEILNAKAIKLFALVDHSGEAAAAGFSMPNAKLLVFGNPKAGTPLMIAAPTLAIDLPMKILVWEDAEARVWLTYNSPDYLRTRHNVPVALIAVLDAVEHIAKAAAESGDLI
ncbi:MAG TPA: DUF302 domain-containing protein [Bryobacteraceae bacterium]|jgi:uncharacterized protein (DUF302 family)|nr:DUF302 domain-containing protein [Bryobacteraceae bacterium]